MGHAICLASLKNWIIYAELVVDCIWLQRSICRRCEMGYDIADDYKILLNMHGEDFKNLIAAAHQRECASLRFGDESHF